MNKRALIAIIVAIALFGSFFAFNQYRLNYFSKKLAEIAAASTEQADIQYGKVHASIIGEIIIDNVSITPAGGQVGQITADSIIISGFNPAVVTVKAKNLMIDSATVTFTFESLAIKDINTDDLNAAFEDAKKSIMAGTPQPTTMNSMVTLDSVVGQNMSLAVYGTNMMTIEKMNVKGPFKRGVIAESASYELTNTVFSDTIPYLSTVAGTDGKVVIKQMKSAGTYSVKTDEYHQTFDLVGRELFDFHQESVFSGLKATFELNTEDFNAIASTLKLHKFNIKYTEKAFVSKIMDMLAGKNPEAKKAMIDNLKPSMTSQLDMLGFDQQDAASLVSAVELFLTDPKSISLSISPAQPTAIIEYFNPEMFRSFNTVVTVNGDTAAPIIVMPSSFLMLPALYEGAAAQE